MHDDPELAALLSQPWSEGACRGYVISAMERCGYKPAAIERVMRELHEVFNFITLEDAQALLSGAPTDYETLCPKGKPNSRAGRRAARLCFP